MDESRFATKLLKLGRANGLPSIYCCSNHQTTTPCTISGVQLLHYLDLAHEVIAGYLRARDSNNSVETETVGISDD